MQASTEDSPSTLKYSLGSRCGRGGGPLGPGRSSNAAGFLFRPPRPASSTNQHSIASGPAETAGSRPGGEGAGDKWPACPPNDLPSGPRDKGPPPCPSQGALSFLLETGSAHPKPQRGAAAEASWRGRLYSKSPPPFAFIFLQRPAGGDRNSRAGQVRLDGLH